MEIKLAKDEKIVKSWNYAEGKTTGASKNTMRGTLTVTSRRLISSVFEQGTQSGFSTNEVLLDDVKSVSASYEKKSPIVAVVVFAALAIGFLIGALSSRIWGMLSATVLFGIVAILVWVYGKKASFYLLIHTYGKEGSSLEVSANILGTRRLKSAGNVDYVRVDPAAAEEIVSTLGSLLLEHRSLALSEVAAAMNALGSEDFPDMPDLGTKELPDMSDLETEDPPTMSAEPSPKDPS